MSLFDKLFGPRLREVKQSQSQAVMMLMYAGQEVVWMKKHYGAYAREGYMACIDAYACIDLIAKSLSAIPLVLYEPAAIAGGERKKIESHPILDLMARPNPGQGQSIFIDAVIRYLLIAGNSYIEAAGPKQGPPRELYTMKPNRVSVLLGSPFEPIAGYRYRAGDSKKDFTAGEVLHSKFFNPDPDEDFYGLAPIEVAARAIDTSNMAQEASGKLVKNNFQPPGAFMIEQSMTPTQEDEFNNNVKAMWDENQYWPLVLSGGKDYKQLSLSPKDSDFIKLDTLTTRKICRVFNVSPELIGDPTNKTYANYQEARFALIMETVLPLAQWWIGDLNNWLVPKFEGRPTKPGELRQKSTLELVWDIDKIMVLQENRQQMYEKLAPAWWFEINERRKMCGLGDWENGEGNVLMIPIGLIPSGDNVVEPPTPAPPLLPTDTKPPANQIPPPDNQKPPINETPPPKKVREIKSSFWSDPERKARLWTAFDQRVASHERALAPLVEKYLKQQADRVRARLQDSTANHRLFNVDEETKAYVERFFPHYELAFRQAGQSGYSATQGKLWDPAEEGKAEPQDTFEVDPVMLAKLKAQIEKSAHFFNETTFGVVSQGIADAAVDNLTTEATAQALWKALGDRAAWEARRIAQTEMTRTDGWGNIEGYKQNDQITMKGWNCSMMPTSRDWHIEADGQEVGIDEDFTVEGEAMAYPGDPRGSAGNVCGCRCSTYPLVE